MSASLYDIPVKRITGEATTLGEYKGRVILVVNVASKCGLTAQYEGLEKLYQARQAQGLVVAGFPANEFKGQEPGSNEEIAEFCSTTFGVQFPMFEKIVVKGPEQHPLYARMIEEQPLAQEAPGSSFKAKLAGYGIVPENENDVLWNFEKFLIGRDGKVVCRFAPDTSADEPMLLQAIDKALAA
ncbi:MAG: glutathione peroxidase [Janthinobacterium lividum]